MAKPMVNDISMHGVNA